MKTPALPAGLLALLLALPCAAADAPAAETSAGKPAEEPGQGEKQARVWFDMLDTNHDGRLEWKEVRFVKRGAIFGANSLRYLSTFLFALCANELHLRQKQPA